MINMVEWDNGPHREMAVDVPESFVPRNKTPPRYPPNKSSTLNSNNNNKAALGKTPSVGLGGGSVVSDGVGVRGNGTLPGQNGAAGKPVPPPRIGDSVNNNNTQVPHVPPRTVVSPSKSAATPSRDEAERIRKYQVTLRETSPFFYLFDCVVVLSSV
jgi:MAGUK p55 subfamily protein 5